MSRFHVVIERIDEEEAPEREYKKISDSGNEQANGPIYGYVETGGKITKREKVVVLEQTVDTVDVAAVIKAVNGL